MEEKAKNLSDLQKQEEQSNRKLLSLEMVLGITCTINFLLVMFSVSYVPNTFWRIFLILAGFVVFGVGIYYCLKLEQETGYYECPNCKEKYVPTLKAVALAPHMGRSRKMKCPYCEQKGYHKKVLTR